MSSSSKRTLVDIDSESDEDYANSPVKAQKKVPSKAPPKKRVSKAAVVAGPLDVSALLALSPEELDELE